MTARSRLQFHSRRGEGVLPLGPGDSDRSLCELLTQAGAALNTRCGMRGLCRGCVVELESGAVTGPEGTQSAPAAIRSCQCHPLPGADIAVEIPAPSLADHRPVAVSEFRIGVPFAQDPMFPAPPGSVALAADIGTTTVVVLAVDPANGNILAEAGDLNHQARFGDNVLTRIQNAGESPVLRRRMQDCIARDTLGPLAREACARAGRPFSSVCGMAVAGNTAMLHLLTGTDPSSLGVAPFRPVFLEPRRLSARELRIADADWPVQLLPSLSSYVGADLAAGIHATGMHYEDRPTLLVDAGTNGEIILKTPDHLLGCATAAGPAFEGGRLACGARAVPGAISHIRIDASPLRFHIETLDHANGAEPIGICGTGFVDFLAEGRRSGLLSPAGRFEASFLGSAPPGVVRKVADGSALVLARRGDGEVFITEGDISQLLQAKAAIAAGILTLLERQGLRPSDVGRVLLAGGFGRHIDTANATRCGLLPGFRPEQIEPVGNTSLAGAYIALLDRNALGEMEDIRARIEIVELNLDPGFEDRFIDGLSLD